MAGRFDIFISYNWAQRELAEALRKTLAKMAKPWYRPRGRRIFLDASTLVAGGGLQAAVLEALQRSDHYLVIASKEAKASRWVVLELQHWLDSNGPKHIFLVLADGDIVWDEAAKRFDPELSTALPEPVLTCFPVEPLWVDLRGVDPTTDDVRVRSAAAGVVGRIEGKDKDEIDGEDHRQQRLARRAFRTIAIVLSILVASLAFVSGYAVQQQHEAERQRTEALLNAKIATAHELAASSRTLLGTRLSSALLFAASSNHQRDDVATRAALLAALTYDPRLLRFVRAPGVVHDLSWLGGSGRLLAWGAGFANVLDPNTGDAKALRPPPGVATAASDPLGTRVAMGSDRGVVTMNDPHSGALVWTRQAFSAGVVAVQFNAAGDRLLALSTRGDVAVIDVAHNAVIAHTIVGEPPIDLRWAGFRDDSLIDVVSLKGQRATLQLTGAELTIVQDWTVPLRQHPALNGEALSTTSEGSWLTFARNGAIQSVRVTGRPIHRPSFNVRLPRHAGGLALSPDNTVAATEYNGVLTVSYAATGTSPSRVLRLPGAATIGSGVAISYDDARVASRYGRIVGFWSLTHLAGIAQSTAIEVPRQLHNTTPQALLTDERNSTVIAIRRVPGTVAGSNELACWSTIDDKLVSTQSIPDGGPLTAIAWGAGHDSIIAASITPARLREVPVTDGCPGDPISAVTATLPSSDVVVSSLYPLPDSSLFVLLRSGHLMYFDARGRLVHSWGGPGDASTSVSAVAVDTDGTEAYLGMRDGAVERAVLDATSMSLVSLQPARGSPVHSMTIVDQGILAVARGHGNVFVIRRDTGDLVRVLSSAQGFRLESTADGSLLVGTTPGGGVAVWDTARWGLIGGFSYALPLTQDAQHASTLSQSALRTSMALGASGRLWLAAAGSYVTGWDLRTSHWLGIACGLLPPPDLSAATDSQVGPKDVPCPG